MMNLFDPRFIRVTADESLIGEKVFFGNSLDDLKDDVNRGNGVTHFLREVKDGCFIDALSSCKWCYVYYDPLYEIKLAYNQGKQIQKKHLGFWENITNLSWSADVEYRIKPEEAWRPYNDFDEFIADVEERFPNTKNRPAGTMPLVWVHTPNNTVYTLITRYDTKASIAFYVCEWKSYKDMYKQYVFSDGTPFGKKEQL